MEPVPTWSTDPWIFLSNFYQFCEGDVGAQIATGLRDFGFVRAGNGHLYAAVHDSVGSIRVFESDDKGRHWREFCLSNLGKAADGGSITGGADPQFTPWLQTSFVCPNIVADGGIAATGSQGTPAMTNTAVLWPTLAADGDVWTFPMANGASGVMVAQQKSRLLLTWSQTFTATDAGPFPPFLPELQANTDPASAGPATDRFQPLMAITVDNQFFGPPLPPPNNGNLLGSYMGTAVQYRTSPCVEDASAPPTFSDPSIQCSQSVFWPYWIGQQSGLFNGATNIHTRAIVLTNP